jgi:hypothetical protein
MFFRSDVDVQTDVLKLESMHGFNRGDWDVQSHLYKTTLSQAVLRRRLTSVEKMKAIGAERKFMIASLDRYGSESHFFLSVSVGTLFSIDSDHEHFLLCNKCF